MDGLEIGETGIISDRGTGREPDRCHVTVRYKFQGVGAGISVMVRFPQGTLLRNPQATETFARRSAAEILRELAGALESQS